jgi:RimJ/RimL family protein N-acetyltransferase
MWRMGKIRVCRLRKRDSRETQTLLREVWPAAYEYPEEWRKRRSLNYREIEKEMDRGYRYFGIRVRGKIVGIYKASIRRDGCFGEHQSIHPDYRGRGLAKLMYRQFFQFAKRNKCKKVYVNILASQFVARKFVESLGFKKKGKEYEQVKGMLVQMYEKRIQYTTNNLAHFRF